MPSDIKISAEFDIKAVQKEVANLEKEIKKLENKQLPVINEFEELRKKAAEAKKSIADAEKALASGKIDKVDYKMITDEALSNIDSYNQKIEELYNKIESLDNQILPLKEQLESLKYTGSSGNSFAQIGEKVKAGLKNALNSLKDFNTKSKISLRSSASAFGNFGKRIMSTFKSAFVFSVIYRGLSELRQYLSAMLGTNQQFTNSLNQVKANLAVAFQPVYQAALPAITALMNLLAKATAHLATFTNLLFGTSIDSSIASAQEMQNTINAAKNGAGGASAAEKELTAAIKEKQKQVKALQRENKAMQREYEQQRKAVEAQTKQIEEQIEFLEKEIDTVNKAEKAMNDAAQAQRDAIQSNIEALQKQQSAISKERSAVMKEQEQAQKAVNAQKKSIDDQIKSINKQIKALQKKQKAEEKAKKENERFTASFDELSTLGTVEEEDPIDLEIEQLREEIDLLQERKENIEDIDYSARLDALDEENEKIEEQIELLREQQDAIKDVDYSGITEGYETLISAMRERIDELNESLTENPLIEQNEIAIEQLQEEIDLLQEKKDAIQSASDAATNFNSSGISKFSDEIEKIKKKIEESPLYKWLSDNQEEIKQFGIILGTLVTAIMGAKGVVWAFSNFSSILTKFVPNGIIAALIAAIAALIVIGGNGQEVIDNLKNAFKLFGEAVTLWLDGDFEGAKKKFAEGWTNIANAGIAAWESIVRALQKGLRWILEKISALEASIPEDSVWHNFFGADWALKNWSCVNEEYHIDRIPVPALATGAVLPPNKPFYALVGDQKHGTNVEAPLTTIEDALRNVMGEQEFNFNFIANGSLGELIRLLDLKLTREGSRKTAFGGG